MFKFDVRMIRFLITCVAILNLLSTSAQNDAYGEATIIYSNQYYLGVQGLTSGFGGKFAYGKYNGYDQVNFKVVELLKLKHPKELKQPSINSNNSRRFVYGKVNAFHALRLGLGKKKLLSDKIRKGAMAIGYSYSFGPSLGLLKPIYVEVDEAGFGQSSSERYDPEIHIPGEFNPSSFFRGVFETKIEPGAFLNCSVLFEFSNEKDGIQQFEVGGSLDAYVRKIPIIGGAEEKRFYVNLFLAYSIGRKFIKR